ncbi:kinase-like domain-containing protein [Usnea florida]
MEITPPTPTSASTPPPLPHPFTYTTPPPTLLTQGAEALLYRTHYLHPTHPCALKHRPSKPYRHPTLDKRLTKHRILSEARTLVKCRREGVSVPAVLGLDCEAGWLLMEWVGGRTVRDVVGKRGFGEGGGEGLRGLMGRVGRAVGRMHEVGVVHGDLTTSNMMVRPFAATGLRNGVEGEVVLIDFGLAGQSVQDEDRAVDLYVLERAFGSTHPEAEEGFQEVLRAYGESYRGAKVVLKRLEDVRLRGRKRSMLG